MPARRYVPLNIRLSGTRLTPIRYVESNKHEGRLFLFRCDCGRESVLPIKRVWSGNTSSCGCVRSEMVVRKNTKHGHGTRDGRGIEYRVWKAMRQRCNDPNAENYYKYGAKGVRVCERWNDFEKFLEDVGPAPSLKHSVDRFPNRRGDYEPGNVRWATASEQARNRDGTQVVEYEGEKYLLVDLAEKHNTTAAFVRSRLARGWSLKQALTLPKGSRI